MAFDRFVTALSWAWRVAAWPHVAGLAMAIFASARPVPRCRTARPHHAPFAFGISRPPVAVRRTLVMRSKLTALSLRVQTLSCAHWGLIGMGALSFVGAGKQPPEAKKPVGSRAGGIPKPIMDAMNLRAVNVASERLPSLLREWKKRATHLAVFDA